ncbi:MAG: anion transporter [Deltaproteobacteria bacterium]|nr:anion transporter [Deltaproteobacteria bacterium]MCW5804775.1 anion transporter [Deltaproteobacteria bacterium]
MVGPLVVFVLTYLVIASRQLQWVGLDRPAGALVGAVAMVVVGGVPMERALAAIDLHVVVLLFGTLVIAAYLQEARFFRLTAYVVLTRARSARSLMFGLVFVVGALSAFLLNDTVCVLLTPLVVAVVVEARLPPLPYLLALASAANVGGVVSFSGNPQNMIVGAAAHGTISFAQYMLLLLPVGAACLAATALVLLWLFRADLPPGPLVARHPPRPAVDKVLAAKGLGALALFAGLALAGVSLAGASMTAAAVLMVVARTPPKQALALIDWQLLVFFAGLFVVVAGVAETGLLEDVFRAISPAIARGDLAGDLAFLALVVIASNVVSNVPLAVIAVTWVPKMPDPVWGYIMLAAGSTLAGTLTLFGSVANLIVMEGAGPRGEIGFWKFLRYGSVITLVNLALAFVILAAARGAGVFGWLGL